MIDKDPNALAQLWQTLCNAFASSSTLSGFATAFVISTVRSLYDGERRKLRILIEAFLCGCLTQPAALAAEAFMHWLAPAMEATSQGIATTVGGMIGFAGVMQVRRIAQKYLNLDAKDVQ